MGRIFEKRKVRMFARWSKTAKAFTKVGKEIAIAIKLGGPDPDGNPRLRMAVQTARGLNMPKERIEAAIKRAAGKDESELQEVNYSGYAPHGVALVIVSATDNPTRTVANVRSALVHGGGSMATGGALDFLFRHVGTFRVKVGPSISLDDLELELIDLGLEELDRSDGEIHLQVEFSKFGTMQRYLEEKKLDVRSAGSQWIPNSTVELPEEKEAEVRNLIEELEEDDDVQHVFDNIG